MEQAECDGAANPAVVTGDNGRSTDVAALLAVLRPVFQGGEFAHWVRSSVVGFAASAEYEEARVAFLRAVGVDPEREDEHVAELEGRLDDEVRARAASRPAVPGDELGPVCDALVASLRLKMGAELSGDDAARRMADDAYDAATVRLLALYDGVETLAGDDAAKLKSAMGTVTMPGWVTGYAYKFGTCPCSVEPEVQVWLIVRDGKIAGQTNALEAINDLCLVVADAVRRALPHLQPYVWARTVSEQKKRDSST